MWAPCFLNNSTRFTTLRLRYEYTPHPHIYPSLIDARGENSSLLCTSIASLTNNASSFILPQIIWPLSSTQKMFAFSKERDFPNPRLYLTLWNGWKAAALNPGSLTLIVHSLLLMVHWMKKENTAEAVSCWNLERILDAEQSGQPMHGELTLDDLLREDMMCSK